MCIYYQINVKNQHNNTAQKNIWPNVLAQKFVFEKNSLDHQSQKAYQPTR